MEHVIQFGINLDDEAITRSVVENAKKQIIENLTKKVSDELGIDNRYYRCTFVDEIAQSIIDNCKDAIIERTASALAEKIPRQKWYREAMAKEVKDEG